DCDQFDCDGVPCASHLIHLALVFDGPGETHRSRASWPGANTTNDTADRCGRAAAENHLTFAAQNGERHDMDRSAGGKIQEARLLVPCLPGKQGACPTMRERYSHKLTRAENPRWQRQEQRARKLTRYPRVRFRTSRSTACRACNKGRLGGGVFPGEGLPGTA